jgi:hypothetical protein
MVNGQNHVQSDGGNNESQIRNRLWAFCFVSVFSSLAATLLISLGDELSRPLKYGVFFVLLGIGAFACFAMIAMLKEHPFLLKDRNNS